MNAIVTAPTPPNRARLAVQNMLSKAFPTWVYPGPKNERGIWTQDSGFLPWCFDLNYWQEGHRGGHMPETAAVEAGVSAYAQTAAMLPPSVWRKRPDGGREELATHALAKVLRRPNGYQTRSDFILNQVRALYLRGNAYALAELDGDGTPTALHPLLPGVCQPYVDPETKDIFYSIAPTEVTPDEAAAGWTFDTARVFPARFVWHMKLQSPRSPLIGETPLQAAYQSVAAQDSISGQQAAFFRNMSRPSGTLNTDMVLTKAQVDELRTRWAEQSQGINLGGVPILSAGLKWNPLSMSSADAQLIEYYKLSTSDIARVLRIPLPLIGEQATSFGSTEILMQFWVASGLGFLLEHMESSLDRFFNLRADEYCEFDTEALLRSNFKERIEGIVRAVQGGVFTPNEGRAREGLASVAAGDEPRMQQQVVPLTYWDEKLRLETEASEASTALTNAQADAVASPPAAPTPPPDPPADDATAADTRAVQAARISRLFSEVQS